MPVTRQDITHLRAQLAEDRKLCASSDLAQRYLDSAEANLNSAEESWARRNPLEYLNALVDEAEIGADTANYEELRAMAADLREWEAALEEIPVALPIYALAEKYLRTLKENYVALYLKHEAETLVASESGIAN